MAFLWVLMSINPGGVVRYRIYETDIFIEQEK